MAVTSVLKGTVGSVTCVSPQCVSTKSSNEAYRPLQTAVIRSAGYAGHDSCNAAATSTKRRNNQHVGRAHPIKNTFLLQHDAHTPLPCTRACHALQARMSVAPATVPVFGSLRLAFASFGNTDSEWPDSHFPKKVEYIAIQSASRDHFSLVLPLILPSRSPTQT